MLAAKLRMAVAALVCGSRKEFCARFRSVNPSTQCDLERLNKWMQGRSLPRAFSVYADLAAVIGSTKTGAWVAECSAGDFAAELAACTGRETQILSSPDVPSRRVDQRISGLFGGMETLAGAFASYSFAWSPRFRGSLIRGSLRLQRDGQRKLTATYAENLLGRHLRLDGEVQIGPRSMDFTLREPDGGAPLFIILNVPGPPASVLCGIMAGAAFVAHESLPSATRIIFIRVADTSALDATNRYLDPTPGAIVDDLMALGLAVREADRVDAVARSLLGDAPEQVTTQEQTTLADMLDGEYMAPADRGAAAQGPLPSADRQTVQISTLERG